MAFGFTTFSQDSFSSSGDTSISIVVSATGVAGTGQIGNAHAGQFVTVLPTGVQAQVQAGKLGQFVGGVSATVSIGPYSITTEGNVDVIIETPVTGTTQLGNETLNLDCVLTVTGVEANTSLNSVNLKTDAVVKPRQDEDFDITVKSTNSGNKYVVNGIQQQMPTALHKGFTYKFNQSDSSNNNHPLRFSTVPDGTHSSNETFTITVQNVNGANKYFVNGVQQQMPFALKKGSTYKFDQSDNSNNNHPLRFSTTPNGSHAGGSEYTNGVTVVGTPGQSGAYTQIVVPNDAPATLYTYCINHSGMGFGVSIAASLQYTDGVTVVGTPGQAGAYTQIVVADNAPSQLYTYCTNHSGMGFGVTVGENVEIKGNANLGTGTTISLGATVFPTEVSSSTALGTVTISLSADVDVVGVFASVLTSNVLVWSEIDTNQDPNWTEIAA